MSAARAALVLALALAFAGPAAAKRAYDLEARDSYFVLADQEEKNPTLVVAPGEEVVVTLAQKGVQPHNWVVDGLARAPAEGVLEAGDGAAVAAFTAPAQEGEYLYYCSVHPPTMRGALVVGTPPDDATGGRPAPLLPALALAALAGAALVRGRGPGPRRAFGA